MDQSKLKNVCVRLLVHCKTVSDESQRNDSLPCDHMPPLLWCAGEQNPNKRRYKRVCVSQVIIHPQ